MLARTLSGLLGAWQRQWWPTERIVRFAEARLVAMVRHAAVASPLYRRKWIEAGVDPLCIHNIKDLQLLPVTEKAEVLASGGRSARAEGVRARVRMHTSGSGGMPLTVPVDSAGFDAWDAIYARALFAAGYRPWDRIAYFWKPRQASTLYEKLGLMRKHFISPLLDAQDQWQALLCIRPRVIYAFPSTLMLLSVLLRGRPREARHLRVELIISHGELLPASTRDLVQAAFGCPVLDQYGAQEFNRIAWECPEARRMHIDLDAVIVEVVNEHDGTPLPPGVTGSLLLTGLWNRAMPLVRYRIGDFGALDEAPCPCGRGLPLLRGLEGRADSVLRRADGQLVSPRQIVPQIEACPGLLQFTVVQNADLSVELQVLPDPAADPGVLDSDLVAAASRLRTLMGRGIEVTVHRTMALARRGRGKVHAVRAWTPGSQGSTVEGDEP